MKKKVILLTPLMMFITVGVVYALTQLDFENTVEIDVQNLETENITVDAKVFYEIGKQLRHLYEGITISEIKLYDSLHELAYESLVIQFSLNPNIDHDEVQIEAFEYLLSNVALINKAQEIGLEVSPAELEQYMSSIRASSGKSEEINQLLQGLEISEDEYWLEYATPQYKADLLISKLMEELNRHADMPKWDELKTDIVNEYIVNEKQKIIEFKNNIGVDEALENIF